MTPEGQIYMLKEITQAVKSDKKRLNEIEKSIMLNIARRLKMKVSLSLDQDESLIKIFERCTDLKRIKW